MITAFQVFCKAAEQLNQRVGRTYVGLSNQEFERESLWLQQGEMTRERVGTALYDYTSTLKIHCNPKKRPGSTYLIEDVFSMVEQVLNVFEQGYLIVESRCLHVGEVTSWVELGMGVVQVTVYWKDEKTEEKLPPMEELYMKEEGV